MFKKFFKNSLIIGVISGIISTLLVMWFIQPLTNCFFPKVIEILTFINTSFSDSIYREIPYTTTARSNLLTMQFSFFVIFFLLLSFLSLFYSFNQIYKNLFAALDTSSPNENISTLEKKRAINFFENPYIIKIISLLEYIFLFFLILQFTFMCVKDMYIKEKASNLSINMEIVSPVLSEYEYKQLRADFYSIDNKKDYDNFVNFLEVIATENDITLKK